jgi:hypothetical protein
MGVAKDFLIGRPVSRNVAQALRGFGSIFPLHHQLRHDGVILTVCITSRRDQ